MFDEHRLRPATLVRIATVGAVMATLGDFGQLWTANSGRPELGLVPPPAWLIVPATLAGALGIPLYALGYVARARLAGAVASRRTAIVAWAGAAFAVIGGTVHAVTGVLVHSRVGQIASGLDPLAGILASGPIVLTLWALALAAFLVASTAELMLPQAPRERLASPLVLTLVLSAATSLLPLPWRDIVQPAVVNLAHVLFFATLLRRC
jgi:hypothetical protein